MPRWSEGKSWAAASWCRAVASRMRSRASKFADCACRPGSERGQIDDRNVRCLQFRVLGWLRFWVVVVCCAAMPASQMSANAPGTARHPSNRFFLEATMTQMPRGCCPPHPQPLSPGLPGERGKRRLPLVEFFSILPGRWGWKRSHELRSHAPNIGTHILIRHNRQARQLKLPC